MPPVLELRGITKAFPGVLANDEITLSLEEGTSQSQAHQR